MQVYLDESGFTGADYCNKEQPLFVLGATWFPDEVSLGIETRIKKKFGCDEIKFTKLARSGKGKGEILEIINDITRAENGGMFCAYVVHKKSALVRKFVMDCIEPYEYKRGIDLLQDGQSVAYANVLSATLPSFMGPKWHEEFLILYNRFIRSKTESDNQALLEHCGHSRIRRKAFDLLRPYICGSNLAMKEVLNPSYRADMYESYVIGIIVHLRNMFGINDFEIIMDNTKATTAPELKGFLDRLKSLTIAHKMSEVCTVQPDIRVKSVGMVDSRTSIGVRMSDLVAGLFAWSYKDEENYESSIAKTLEMKIEKRHIIHMIASTDVTPESLGMKGSRNPWG